MKKIIDMYDTQIILLGQSAWILKLQNEEGTSMQHDELSLSSPIRLFQQ